MDVGREAPTAQETSPRLNNSYELLDTHLYSDHAAGIFYRSNQIKEIIKFLVKGDKE